jgi:hypothetical protein
MGKQEGKGHDTDEAQRNCFIVLDSKRGFG